MIAEFRIDLRSLSDTERDLIEAAMEKLAEAAYEEAEDRSPFFYEAAALAQALFIIRDRKPEKPKSRRKGGDRHEPEGRRPTDDALGRYVAPAGADGAKPAASVAPAEPHQHPDYRSGKLADTKLFRHAPTCASLTISNVPMVCDCGAAP